MQNVVGALSLATIEEIVRVHPLRCDIISSDQKRHCGTVWLNIGAYWCEALSGVMEDDQLRERSICGESGPADSGLARDFMSWHVHSGAYVRCQVPAKAAQARK